MNNPRDYINHQDGFGLAWMKHREWQVYKKPFPYDEDQNFENKINHIPKEMVIGHLRKIFIFVFTFFPYFFFYLDESLIINF